MRARTQSSVAAALVLTFLMHAPARARADEPEPAQMQHAEAPSWLFRSAAPIDIGIADLARAHTPLTVGAPLRSPFAPAPADIRLSKGATTAIIVGAIVVGVLLIAGIVVLSKPGKLH